MGQSNMYRLCVYEIAICCSPLYTILQETDRKLDRSLIDQHLRLYVLRKIRGEVFFFFCGNDISTEVVLLLQLSSKAGISF